jgi:hypothetical protein
MIYWDWSRYFHTMVSVDAAGGLAKIEDLPLGDHKWGSDIDIIFGANGAMYVLQWSLNGYNGGAKAFYKIEYHGPLNEAACAVALRRPGEKAGSSQGIPAIMGLSAIRLPAGALGADAFSPDGRKVWSYTRSGDARREERVELPGSSGHGLVRIRFR